MGSAGGALFGAERAKVLGAYLTGGDTPDKLGPPLTLPSDTALTPTVTTSDGSQYALVQIEGKYTWFSIQDNPALPSRYVEVVSGARAAQLTSSYLQAAGFESQLAQAQAEVARQQREALREAFARSEIQSANNMGPNGLPWGTPSAIGANATQTWARSPEPARALNILEVRNADGSVSRIVQEVDKASGVLLGDKTYENPEASNPNGFRLVATSDYQGGVHWTLNRETGLMEQAGGTPAKAGGPSVEDGFAPDGSPLGQAATVIHEGRAHTTVWARDAATGHYTETETITRRDGAGNVTQSATAVRSYAADGTELQSAPPPNPIDIPVPPVQRQPLPAPIPQITTHESRIVPTPGGMSFAEAHKRRDEPELISPGSLRPVGKLDVSGLDRKSMLHRMHQSQELDLMRQLEIAKAKDREEFSHEPAVQRTREQAQERTQERAQERTNERTRDHTQERIPDPEARSVRSAHAAGADSHQNHGLPVPQAAPAARLPQLPESSAHRPLAEEQATRARLSQDHARQEHRGQADQQREPHHHHHQLRAQPEGQERRSWPPQPPQSSQAEPEQAPRLRDFSDPSHPQNALYNLLKEGFPQGATPEWLALSTAACYKSGIKKPGDLGDVEGRDDKIFFSPNSVFAKGAIVDLARSPPSVQETMQQVQQFEQERADNLAWYQAEIAQANRQQGQGPVM